MMRLGKIAIFAATVCVSIDAATFGSTLGISDFNNWTKVRDPIHPGMGAQLDNATQARLSATGAIPAGTDVGYQSVSSIDVETSKVTLPRKGYYFSASESFLIAIDFDVTTMDSVGLAAIGMGVGEDGDGMNSAGPALAITNGVPTAFSGGARINDVTQPPALFGPAAALSGRLFVEYDSSTGDIFFGVNLVPGSAAPSHTGSFPGLQNQWADKDLLVSFFLRSDEFIIPALSAGIVEAVFSNFEVLEGQAIQVIPEPASAGLTIACLAIVCGVGRRRKIES